MPARWPTSEMVVSQFPRCPAAILSVSCARAGTAEASTSAISAARNHRTRVIGYLLFDASLGCRCCQGLYAVFSQHAQGLPARGLRDDAFEGTQPYLRDAPGCGADGLFAHSHAACGLDHDTAELHD